MSQPQEQPVPMPPFKAFLASNIPSVYDNTLSYYDELTKLLAYLEKQVVPQVNANTEGLAQLKKFVEDYFDNLDVQEEINNKLDDMAEKGELATIIAQFLTLAPVFAYDTVADMAAAENLIDGCIARTLGFHAKDDKGGAFYSITDTATANGKDVIALQGDLFAVLIKTPDTTVNQYGAYGDGETDDAAVIQYVIENNQHATVKFADCTYAIGTTLQTYVDNTKKSCLVLEPTTTIKAATGVTLDALFELGGLGGNNLGTTDRFRCFEGGILDATNCTAAIEVNPDAIGIIIKDVTINNAATYGIYVPKGDGTVYSSDLSVVDSYINCTTSNASTYGVYVERSDNKFDNIRINNCKVAFYADAGGQYYINCHALGVGPSDSTTWFADTEFLHQKSGGGNFLTNCYCDTLQTYVDNESTGMVTMNGCFYYSYIEGVDVILFKMGSQTPNLKVVNCQFNVPTAATYHKGIVFSNFNAQSTVHGIYLNDNYVSKYGSFIAGDLLLAKQSTQLYWTDVVALSTSDWTKIGYITSGAIYHSISVDVSGIIFNAHFRVGRSQGVTTLTKRSGTKSSDSYALDFGVKFENNTNGNTVYALYVKQNTGATLNADITVNNFNLTNLFVPATHQLANAPVITETMDATFTI